MDVTVAIPTFNSACTIMSVLQRLLHQDVKPTILMIDNGSKDGTVEMLQAVIDNKWFGAADIVLQTAPQLLGGREKNIPYMRHKLAQAVETEYLFFLDSDVLLQGHCLLDLKEYMDEDANRKGVAVRYDPLADHVQFGAILMKTQIAKQIKWNTGEGKCECRWAVESLKEMNPDWYVTLHPDYQAMHLKGF
ncbi:MAG TPA: glycosyltransferase family A protein [Anaerohalosphaeraceae bacterium]|nr:glycosyltransferase family A protein [Anaerohalosphaeraceae bacterium]HOL31311.1 glycosyltransferase family A protein [Anaerohalosphaeraceae bacterium]HOM77079.1 glycosyltransferase family A protein [Anaerohalosphaeraceae bacterium]HPC64765.1 glycosyltransferase family A protein [Anaerohalosphaeraceae bacterium]HRS71799.1 glycosyltransferase family A protein [Anaerohalosphaeraceae bacterium]